MYNNVYVNRDMTYIQRQELRERRRQLIPVSTASSAAVSTVSNSYPLVTSTVTTTHVITPTIPTTSIATVPHTLPHFSTISVPTSTVPISTTSAPFLGFH